MEEEVKTLILNDKEFAVVDESAGSVVGEVLLVVELLHRRGLQPYRVVERIRVEVMVGNAFHFAELISVHAVEAVGERFRRRRVHGIMVAFRGAPVLAQLVHTAHDRQRELLAFRIPYVILHPILAVEHTGRLIQADVSKRHGGAFVAEQLIDAVVGAETSERAEAEQRRSVDGSGLLATHDTELQRLMGDRHAFVEQLPEAFLVSVGFQCDARNVHRHHA